jgi:hypothetical protein
MTFNYLLQIFTDSHKHVIKFQLETIHTIGYVTTFLEDVNSMRQLLKSTSTDISILKFTIDPIPGFVQHTSIDAIIDFDRFVRNLNGFDLPF